jgi:hypothetical protein
MDKVLQAPKYLRAQILASLKIPVLEIRIFGSGSDLKIESKGGRVFDLHFRNDARDYIRRMQKC